MHALTIGQTCEATQEVPLLKAKDGALIALDEYYYGEDGKRYTITGLGAEYVWGREEGLKVDKRLKPEWLTSKRPDSWEQLEKDLHARTECSMSAVFTPGCTSFLSCTDCCNATAKEIIRRAKALAGVEQ